MMEIGLLADVEANRQRHCVRPVLHGDPLSGDADAEIRGLVEDPDYMNQCYDLFAEFEHLYEWQMDPRGDPPPDVVLATWLCEPAAHALVRAVRHEDACSPYLMGRTVPNPRSGGLVGAMRLAKAASLVAHDLARRDKTHEAIALLTDTIRFGQDLGRGFGADPSARIAGGTVEGIVLEFGIRPLLDFTPLELGDLEYLARDLRILLATEPELSEVIDRVPASGVRAQPPG